MLRNILGSYGSVPTPVTQACKAITDEVEGSPDKFMRLRYPTSLNNCRERVAGLIGAHVDECVLVPNAIYGINTILRNIGWQKGDAILKSNILITFLWRVTELLSSGHHLRCRRQSDTFRRRHHPPSYIGDD